ncbi:gliding motility-associated C-terminal domain-containing protein [Chryseobacterium sp. SSA4.19]|uniref:T9SS type B sorting domain-containing protein n=1 Tax=Chryseobacterium sp. SSA4.19 TaxID=2919915 RepID=UPI001F4E1A78|nr:T9SS type B sorting domain-containing protein [Chryseobacterium sp. SSA4.19]MCJ8152551.1 gliding motility-associated C-terminal domain-containing protein [Chryseobacterium sp. SSA4.19]
MKKLLLLTILFFSQLLFSQSDCISAIPVCGNSNISYNPSSNGTIPEATANSCLDVEHYSVWYVFTAATSGTIEFTINPNTVPNVLHYDYDFAVYGPNINCATWDFGNAIRCNFSGTSGATGLSSTITGDQWEEPLDVIAGETYYLLIDNYIPSNPYGFSLTWGGTATLSSAFTDPTLAPNPFVAPGTPNPAGGPNEVETCPLPGMFDFSTLSAEILNGNPNFIISYHTTANDALFGTAPVTAPITVDATSTYYYSIHYQDPADPDNPLNACRQTGSFKFKLGEIPVHNTTVFACANNGATTGTFNLTTADVYFDATATKKFYLTLNDLNAGVNEIQNTNNYVSGEKTLYVKVITSAGCIGDTTVNLAFHPKVIAYDASMESCFIEFNVTSAAFNLNLANVTSQTGHTKVFYKTQADAIAGINPIVIADPYVSTSGVVYVRVISEKGCYAISKITLKVLPPVKSNVLKDKIICIEDTTTLDAGAGFDGYEWSTGATTQSITNVGAGAYWVKLKTGQCWTLQEVKVNASVQPVITNIEITNDSFTVTVNGGKPPYKYSLDGINWQDSNVFTGLPRGENKVYVKDAYDCNPIEVQVTVPNLINAITPNGDNVNDYIDYSALSYKKNLVFTIYDRYGNMMYTADKMRDYKWDGTTGGKKVMTGTYWYTITWNENNKNSTPTKYSGWILVKNIK